MTPGKVLTDRPGQVVAVYAHPDDLEISCGGTLASWAGAGSTVHLVVCTRGEKGSTDPQADVDALAKRRACEARQAAALLGAAGIDLLGYDDGTIQNDVELRGRLVAIVRRHRPEVVICPDPTASFFGSTYVNHHDHREVGWACVDACAPAAASPLYYPEAGPAHAVRALLLSGTLDADAWVDISATVDRKAAALACHRSQLGGQEEWVEEWVRQRAATEGARAGVAYAESFRRIQLAAG